MLVVVSTWPARTQLVMQTGKSRFLVAPAPVADRRRADSATQRHFPVGLAFVSDLSYFDYIDEANQELASREVRM